MITEDDNRQRATATLRRSMPVSKKRDGPPAWSKTHYDEGYSRNVNYATIISLSDNGKVNPSHTWESTRTKESRVNVSADSLQRNSQAAKKGSRTPSGRGSHSDVRTPTFWPCTALADQAMRSTAPNIRSFWEANIAQEREKRETLRSAPPKPYSFPKWRSTDALSASLVASNSVDVPKDSKIPERRLQKMRETDRQAELQRALIQQRAESPRRIRKGKSLDSLNIQLDYQPWYDRNKIRNSISRESIANIAEARERFEPQNTVTNNLRARRYSGHSTQTAASELSSVNGTTLNHDRPLYEAATNTSYTVNNGYHTELYPESATTTAARHFTSARHERGFTLEEQLFMIYMKQNPDVISNLGIRFPSFIQQTMDDLQCRRVELRLVDSGSPVPSQSPRQGRFLKKSQAQPSNHIRKSDAPPTKERDEMQQRYSTYGADPAEKRIGSMIKYEMMQLREREDELQKSRRELGLPSLEETMELWRHGNSDALSYRSASYIRMNDLGQTQLQRNPQPSELSSTNGSWDY